MNERGPLSVSGGLHMMAAQLAFWGFIGATMVLGNESGLLFMVIFGPILGAYCIWVIVRFLNWREDSRHARLPEEEVEDGEELSGHRRE
ncbi:MAG: hypothetical protein ACKV0T_28865 [Planctomycetales bacterium]